MTIFWDWWSWTINIFILVNIGLAIYILYFEKERASSLWAWILLLFFLPVIGFFLYITFGKPFSKKKLKSTENYVYPLLRERVHEQMIDIDRGEPVSSGISSEFKDSIRMALKSEGTPITRNNQIEFYTHGQTKFDALYQDIEAAKDHVHLEYFRIRDDELGRRFLRLLTDKSKQGVKVLLLYDYIGSFSMNDRALEELRLAGGKAVAFLPAKKLLINPNVNYRNHRKIAVVDGHTGYTGGFNIGDEYLGKNSEHGYWRDTHIRLSGEAVHFLQDRFLTDWNQATDEYPVDFASSYFPKGVFSEGADVQIVSSGPDNDLQQIRDGLFKLITQAKKSIYVQTPYFVPDPPVLEALRTAALSGLDVKLMIPFKSDSRLIQEATLNFAKELLVAGAEVYTYSNGFLHAKTLIVDEKAFSVGSANLDNRSFSLNFETNAFVYDQPSAEGMVRIFRNDLELCEPLTGDSFRDRSLIQRLMQKTSSLIAPLL